MASSRKMIHGVTAPYPGGAALVWWLLMAHTLVAAADTFSGSRAPAGQLAYPRRSTPNHHCG
jgi:hypothetical protein